MANTNAPRGFRLYQKEAKCVCSREYAKTAAANIYEGDLVMRVPAGTVEPYVAGTAANAGRVIGVASRASLGTSDTTIDVIDDPEATYVCQVDATTAYAVADNGLNADIAGSPSPNTDLKRSGQVLDMSTAAITDTLPIKVLKLAPQINNEENSPAINADVLCKVNFSERAQGTDGI